MLTRKSSVCVLLLCILNAMPIEAKLKKNRFSRTPDGEVQSTEGESPEDVRTTLGHHDVSGFEVNAIEGKWSISGSNMPGFAGVEVDIKAHENKYENGVLEYLISMKVVNMLSVAIQCSIEDASVYRCKSSPVISTYMSGPPEDMVKEQRLTNFFNQSANELMVYPMPDDVDTMRLTSGSEWLELTTDQQPTAPPQRTSTQLPHATRKSDVVYPIEGSWQISKTSQGDFKDVEVRVNPIELTQNGKVKFSMNMRIANRLMVMSECDQPVSLDYGIFYKCAKTRLRSTRLMGSPEEMEKETRLATLFNELADKMVLSHPHEEINMIRLKNDDAVLELTRADPGRKVPAHVESPGHEDRTDMDGSYTIQEASEGSYEGVKVDIKSHESKNGMKFIIKLKAVNTLKVVLQCTQYGIPYKYGFPDQYGIAYQCEKASAITTMIHGPSDLMRKEMDLFAFFEALPNQFIIFPAAPGSVVIHNRHNYLQLLRRGDGRKQHWEQNVDEADGAEAPLRGVWKIVASSDADLDLVGVKAAIRSKQNPDTGIAVFNVKIENTINVRLKCMASGIQHLEDGIAFMDSGAAYVCPHPSVVAPQPVPWPTDVEAKEQRIADFFRNSDVVTILCGQEPDSFLIVKDRQYIQLRRGVPAREVGPSYGGSFEGPWAISQSSQGSFEGVEVDIQSTPNKHNGVLEYAINLKAVNMMTAVIQCAMDYGTAFRCKTTGVTSTLAMGPFEEMEKEALLSSFFHENEITLLPAAEGHDTLVIQNDNDYLQLTRPNAQPSRDFQGHRVINRSSEGDIGRVSVNREDFEGHWGIIRSSEGDLGRVSVNIYQSEDNQALYVSLQGQNTMTLTLHCDVHPDMPTVHRCRTTSFRSTWTMGPPEVMRKEDLLSSFFTRQPHVVEIFTLEDGESLLIAKEAAYLELARRHN